MSKGLTSLQAAEIVLKYSDRPLSAQEIVDEIRKRQLTKISGETPLHTMNARISVDIKKNGKLSRFARTGRGRYTLRERVEKEYSAIPFQRRVSPTEVALVFPSEKLDSLGHFHGIRKDYEKYAQVLLNADISFFMSRLDAERDSNYKQIVSYVIVKYKDSVLRFTRGKITNIGQYLHGQYSIGFGGHVEGRDRNLFGLDDSGYANSVIRELEEEIAINPLEVSPYNFRVIGVLNDDSTDLGRHHFTFIHQLDLFAPNFKKGEISVNDLRLISIPSLADEFGGYEYWSKLCIQTYFGDRLSIDCHIHPRPGFSLRDQSEIILLVGYNGSGKTTACDLLADEFGYTLVPCSRIMQEIIDCPPIEKIGRKKLQDLGFKFITEESGDERLAQGILNYMSVHNGPRFVLDGLRYPRTLEVLKDLLGRQITIIFIEATIDSLFLSYRSREGRTESFDDFLEILNHPVEREIERFWPIADITVYNHGSRESYLNTLRGFFMNELE